MYVLFYCYSNYRNKAAISKREKPNRFRISNNLIYRTQHYLLRAQGSIVYVRRALFMDTISLALLEENNVPLG